MIIIIIVVQLDFIALYGHQILIQISVTHEKYWSVEK